MKKLLGSVVICFATLQMASGIDDPQVKKAESAKKVYDEKADAKALIDAALSAAKKENRRVLVQWGGNWCSWCLLLHERCHSDRDLAKTLRYEYDVVYIDSKNTDLIAKYGADIKKEGVPFLTVLDSDGKVLTNQSTVPFETKIDGKNGHDPKKLQEFFLANKAPQQKAETVLANALAEASKSDRRVFLHFGAPWCGWCLKLDAWLARPEIAKIIGKDFVEVKIDTDRMAEGKDALARFNTSGKGGIPWFAILDSKGKVLTTSDGAKGNIGFPAEPDEIAHFIKMLEETKKNLGAEDIALIRQSLTKTK